MRRIPVFILSQRGRGRTYAAYSTRTGAIALSPSVHRSVLAARPRGLSALYHELGHAADLYAEANDLDSELRAWSYAHARLGARFDWTLCAACLASYVGVWHVTRTDEAREAVGALLAGVRGTPEAIARRGGIRAAARVIATAREDCCPIVEPAAVLARVFAGGSWRDVWLDEFGAD